MSKKKVHTSQNQGRKTHKNGIKMIDYSLSNTKGVNQKVIKNLRAQRTHEKAKNFQAKRNIWAK